MKKNYNILEKSMLLYERFTLCLYSVVPIDQDLLYILSLGDNKKHFSIKIPLRS